MPLDQGFDLRPTNNAHYYGTHTHARTHARMHAHTHTHSLTHSHRQDQELELELELEQEQEQEQDRRLSSLPAWQLSSSDFLTMMPSISMVALIRGTSVTTSND